MSVPVSIEPGNLSDIRVEKVEKKEVRMQSSGSEIVKNEEKQPGVESKDLNSGQKLDKPAPPPSAQEPGSDSSPPIPGSDAEQQDREPPPPESGQEPPPMDGGFDNAIDNSMPKPGEIRIPIELGDVGIPGGPNEDNMARQEDLIRQENEKIVERIVEDVKRLPDLPKPPY